MKRRIGGRERSKGIMRAGRDRVCLFVLVCLFLSLARFHMFVVRMITVIYHRNQFDCFY